MTRKLGRLLVVALVVAAVVAPMSVASADVAYVPACNGIVYDATNPYHILITDIDFSIKTYINQWDLWNERHHAGPVATAMATYLNFNMMDVVRARVASGDLAERDPGTNHYILFYDDSLGEALGLALGTPLRISGTRWADIMCGSPGPDVIRGLGGNDIIYGGPTTGDYALDAANDDDIITGGPGDDILAGGYGEDAIEGRAGNDKVFGTSPTGLAGAEFLTPFSSRALSSRAQLVTMSPTSGRNDLWGGNGNDEIYAGLGPDEGTGGPGNDLLVGAAVVTCAGTPTFAGENYFWGQAGNDTIKGGACDDHLYGGAGDDTIWGQLDGTLGDVIYGDDLSATSLATGNDTIYGAEPTGLAAWYLVSQLDVINGGPGNDTLYGDMGADVSGLNIIDPSGDDTIVGGPGADWLVGGLGNDTIYGGFNVVPTGVTVTTDGADTLLGEAGNDTLYGGFDADLLYGDGDSVYILPSPFTGLEGTDTLYGGDGNDVLYGGDKADTFWGGAGIDNMVGGYAASAGDGDKDAMNGENGDDGYYGACLDLDDAYEPTAAPAVGGIDSVHQVSGLWGYFEIVVAPTC